MPTPPKSIPEHRPARVIDALNFYPFLPDYAVVLLLGDGCDAAFEAADEGKPWTAPRNLRPPDREDKRIARAALREYVKDGTLDIVSAPVFTPAVHPVELRPGPTFCCWIQVSEGDWNDYDLGQSQPPRPEIAGEGDWSFADVPVMEICGKERFTKSVRKSMVEHLQRRHGETGTCRPATFYFLGGKSPEDTTSDNKRGRFNWRPLIEFESGGNAWTESHDETGTLRGIPTVTWRDHPATENQGRAIGIYSYLVTHLITGFIKDPRFDYRVFRRDDDNMVLSFDVGPLGFIKVDGRNMAVYSGLGCDAERLLVMHEEFVKHYVASDLEGSTVDVAAALAEHRTDICAGYMVF